MASINPTLKRVATEGLLASTFEGTAMADDLLYRVVSRALEAGLGEREILALFRGNLKG